MSCVRCVRELGWSWVRGGTTEEKEEKARNASLKQKPHTEMWGKNPHSDELCDEVKKKQQQEESCYRDTMTKSNKSNVHRRPTSDVHKRPTFDVHRRPPNQQTWSELTLLVNCLGRLHALNKKRNDTQTADFGRCLDCKPKNNWLRLGVLVPPLFDGEKCKFPMLQLNLGGQICFTVHQ